MSYLLFLFIVITMMILLLGVLSMAGGDKISKKFGTKLMTLRVVFQALAILALIIFYFFSSK
ncbi:MAG: HIG1 domain-containing protein [Rickettsiaceae bacterium]|jgi:hypothetical protein|uniref:HIG1 domain-containing protein n=1 Tax=Candidatus Megaera polyxenophila TaxID=988779 RepID=UPI001B6D1510|nr:HIG1 domain-containing protein [Candidatus Megaera polyxenophila]MBP9777941.1 HIG1 domain-containing protein [Rickettsiaceae bacterium]MBU6184092.1 HIG1 domain-containing protein [Rickettsiales bacterium]NBU52920.1 hypothetical protein [Alphaproteobacteria bacterium]UCM93906.1 MAG: HIG1 domain-containing protein [Candidatus Megaira endosymbiont of Mesostigma viride]HJK85200.1 HIG1 domain-containing protein [Candidatus Megaera endosymbiont of Stentor roeselii]